MYRTPRGRCLVVRFLIPLPIPTCFQIVNFKELQSLYQEVVCVKYMPCRTYVLVMLACKACMGHTSSALPCYEEGTLSKKKKKHCRKHSVTNTALFSLFLILSRLLRRDKLAFCRKLSLFDIHSDTLQLFQ